MKLADSWEPEAPTAITTSGQLYDEYEDYDEVDESKDGCGGCSGGSTCLTSLVRATMCCLSLQEKF
jgi:hypothetical protein